jgi:GPH family glycoside/pentoside/hexuronide:cation symporter
MTMHEHHQTSAADRVSFAQKVIYGTGQISNVILAIAIANLAPFVLTVELGVSAVLVGLAMGLPRVWDAFTDPVVGYLSDNARTKWGRRKPFMFVGLLAVGACLALMWQMPRGWSDMGYFWFFFGMSIVFYLAYTFYATPFVALGYELTPDYHERTRVMGVMNFMGNLAAVPMAWMFAVMQWDAFEDGVQGARFLAIILAVLVVIFGLVPIIFLRDPTRDRFSVREDRSAKGASPTLGFFDGLKTTLKNRSFLYLCLATLLFFPGLTLIQNFGSFLLIYYVYAGAKDAASVLIGWSGTLSAVLTLAFIPVVTWLGTHVGKRRAFMICAASALFGTLLKWFCYQPSMPYINLLPGPFVSIGFAALWVLTGAMMADVCDQDELATGERREGTYSAVFWWIVKLGLSSSLVLSGVLLKVTGFQEKAGADQSADTFFWMRVCDVAFPALFIAVAIYLIYRFPLTEERAYEIKGELARRKSEQPA